MKCSKVKSPGILIEVILAPDREVEMKKGVINNCVKCLSIMAKNEPKMFLIQILFSSLHGLSWTLQVVFTQKFFDLAQNVAQKSDSVFRCIYFLLVMILTYVFCQIMNGVDNCHSNILNKKILKHIKIKIFKQIDKMNCENFENENNLEEINKAIYGGENIVWISLTIIDTIFFYSTYFGMMAIYMFSLKPILSISVLVIFIPCVLSNIIRSRSFENLEEKSAPIRRECECYKKHATEIKETRMLGANNYFKNLYFSSLDILNKMTLKVQIKKHVTNLFLDSITALGYGVILFILVVLVLKQEITVGVFAAVFATIGRLFDFMNEVISERIKWASENMASIGNYLSFVSHCDELKSTGEIVKEANISLRNVCYSYPNSNRFVLNNINLKIKNGETIAIVGENGSGKTTLCKLIMGIYYPSQGEIRYNDIPSNDINKCNVTAIFQNYCQYKMTLRENISISEINSEISEEQLRLICEKAGVNLQDVKYDNKLDTIIGREFDGIELSGGQWQRVAIARGIRREHDFIVLDEPTSAIDPLEETKLYEKFNEICKEKTAIIVTHRLGTVKIADRIIVLKNGSIIEEGTHEDLMKLDGEYCKMFSSQRRHFV